MAMGSPPDSRNTRQDHVLCKRIGHRQAIGNGGTANIIFGIVLGATPGMYNGLTGSGLYGDRPLGADCRSIPFAHLCKGFPHTDQSRTTAGRGRGSHPATSSQSALAISYPMVFLTLQPLGFFEGGNIKTVYLLLYLCYSSSAIANEAIHQYQFGTIQDALILKYLGCMAQASLQWLSYRRRHNKRPVPRLHYRLWEQYRYGNRFFGFGYGRTQSTALKEPVGLADSSLMKKWGSSYFARRCFRMRMGVMPSPRLTILSGSKTGSTSR